jgi:hypothetical protein
MRKFLCLALAFGWILALAAAPQPPRHSMADLPVSGSEACTVSARVYLITETGLIGVGFSITAETCSEAYSGVRQAVLGFLKAF